MRDAACDAAWIRAQRINTGITLVIRPNPTRARRIDDDRHLYQARHVVEVFLNRLKHWLRLATRVDKAATTYLALRHFVALGDGPLRDSN